MQGQIVLHLLRQGEPVKDASLISYSSAKVLPAKVAISSDEVIVRFLGPRTIT